MDRKANCPSYRKKTEAKSLSLAKIQSSLESGTDQQSQYEANQKAGESSGTTQQHPSPQKSETGGKEQLDQADANVVQGSCHVANCAANACHTIRRKWLVKMRKTICKILEINLDQSNAAMTLIPICDGHYERISHLMVCAMCQRRLPKNHIYYIVNVSFPSPSTHLQRKRQTVEHFQLKLILTRSLFIPPTQKKKTGNSTIRATHPGAGNRDKARQLDAGGVQIMQILCKFTAKAAGCKVPEGAVYQELQPKVSADESCRESFNWSLSGRLGGVNFVYRNLVTEIYNFKPLEIFIAMETFDLIFDLNPDFSFL